MQYQGGKHILSTRIVESICERVNNYHRIYEPFCGGCNVTVKLVHKFNEVYAFDLNEALIYMYVQFQNGWNPPTRISEKMYRWFKDHKPKDSPFTAFIGFGCTWGAMWFGGYARGKNQNFARQTHNWFMKHQTSLNKVFFGCLEYTCLNVQDSVIYADPPYHGVKKHTFSFDHEIFWKTVKK